MDENMKKKKFFLYGAAAFIIIFIVAAGVFFTRNKTGQERSDEPSINNPDIRVLIMTDDFVDITHPVMEISAAAGMEIVCGEEKREVKAGETVSFKPDDEGFGKERGTAIRIQAKEGGEITLNSIQRAYGTPSYAGII